MTPKTTDQLVDLAGAGSSSHSRIGHLPHRFFPPPLRGFRVDSLAVGMECRVPARETGRNLRVVPDS